MSSGPPDRKPHDRRISRRRVLQTAATSAGMTVLAGSSLASYPTHLERRTGQQVRELRNRQIAQEYNDINTIREEAWVETETDTDGTGEPDRVHVEVARPVESDKDGQQVPVVLRPDPYRSPQPSGREPGDPIPGTPDLSEADETMEVDLYHPGQTSDSEEVFFYERTLVDAGYAFAYVAPIGSSLSTGCNVLGGPPEVASVKAAIDWFNGRATAYDSRERGDPVDTAWTTGKTGLFGESYRGALANGVATTGVEGLETIVSIRAISSWYTYVRSNGAVIVPGDDNKSRGGSVALLSAMVTTREDSSRCDDVIADIAEQVARDTGNYNDFWAERDYVRDAGNVEASVFLVHGLYDQQVRPTDFARWLDALKEHDVPYNVWLHQGDHDDPRERHETPWVERLLAWLDYWLKGEVTGVMDDLPVTVEREDGSLVEQDDWPHPDTQRTTVRFEAGGEDAGRLGFDAPTESVTESFVDNSDIEPASFLGDGYAEHRLFYRTPALSESVHVSGRIRPQLTLSFDSPAALVSVALVDYGPVRSEIVNRGWMNPLNRNALDESEPLEPGEPYSIEFPMEPVDYVFEEGHRLGILVYSSDHNVTKRPPSTPELTLHLDESSLDIPIVGGTDTLSAAIAGETGAGADESDDSENGDGSGSDSENGGDPADESGNGDDSVDEADEADMADDGGPGFSIVSALAGAGGIGYLLQRRRKRQNERMKSGR